MPVQIQVRRDTAANWASANPVLGSGEIALSTDTQTIKVGNGTSTWSALPTSTLTLAQLAYSGLDQNADLIFGAGAATTGILNPSSSTNSTVVQANSAANLGVSRIDVSTGIISDVSTTGAVSGDLLRYNTSNSRWEPITYSNLLTAVGQKIVQNIAFRQAGYFSRGSNNANVYRWSFPADTVTTARSTPNSLDDSAGFANPNVAGYFSHSPSTAVYKYAFPAETVSTTTAAPASMIGNAGFANPSVAGYFSRNNNLTTVYKWTFPTDAVSTTTAAPAGMSANAGFANPSVAGYFSRAYDGSALSTTVYKWTFPADTVSTTTAAPAVIFDHAGFSNPSVAGYFSRGFDGVSVYTSTVYKWAFPSDTVSTTTAAPTDMGSNSGFANSSVAGYFCRGSDGYAFFDTVYKWAFPADTVSTTTPAPIVIFSNAGFANS